MLYLIGLGLNEKGISLEGIEALKICKKIYFENYTVNFPYSVQKIEDIIERKIIPANREFVEGMNELLNEAKKENIALLVYGSPLTATTHISLIQEAKKEKVKYEIIYGASVFDAIAETGLQLYKFGKIASMPKWSGNYKPTSFMEIIRDNQKINAHSLILIDIGLDLEEAMKELEKIAGKDKVVVCSRLGTKETKIYYNNISKLKTLDIKSPFCFIIPSKLHFMEEEILESFG